LDVYPIKFGSDGEASLKKHLKLRINALKEGLNVLHEEKLPKWRKAYEAVPREAHREWPFPNASNNIIPIIAIHTDTLLARVMSAVIKTNPIWYSKMYGDHGEGSDDLRSAFEEAMQYVAIEPFELDLYRVYHEWFGEAIKYGTSILKAPWEKKVIQELIPAGDGTGEYDFIPNIVYDGPRPEKLPFEDFLCPPSAKTLAHADIKIHRRKMLRHELMERRYKQVYDASRVDQILDHPDRTSPSQNQSMKEETLGVRTASGYGYAEWDLYECHLEWRMAEKNHKIIATYHESTDTLLRGIYDTNPLPIFVGARLFYRDDMFYGYGFAETLWSFQEEISEIHNQRRDNQTIANTKVWRVSPDSKLHSGFRIYPGAMLPAEENEIEPLQHGEVSEMSIDEEKLALDLAERRSGVSPPQQGYGAGTNTKRGIYSASGTLALMQDGNRRTDLNISDFRYAHTILGRILSQQYATEGYGKKRLELFGSRAEQIEEAFKAVKDGTMGIPVYSSTSSVNKEVEKQSDIMLNQIMNQHYQMISALLAQLQNPLVPPEVKDYTSKVIKSSNRLMKAILKDFDRDDGEDLVPEPSKPSTQPKPFALPGGGLGGGQNQQPNGSVPSQTQPIPSMAGGAGGQGVSSLASGVTGGQ
jgi:hypothetical protein